MRDSTDHLFERDILDWYRVSGRHNLPWRVPGQKYIDPYYVLVSEMMLQQTQVARVVDYFQRWITLFPTVAVLAAAPTDQVIRLWQGLGYNRRALYLQSSARTIVELFGGNFYPDTDWLRALPGVGPYVASALRVFVWNIPDVCIETNIRRVFLYQYRDQYGQQPVSDSQIAPFVQQSVTYITESKICSVRDWYYALMDYGSTLPRVIKHNPNTQSKHYTKQSQFAGSRRQVRGAVIRMLSCTTNGIPQSMFDQIAGTHTITEILEELESEGFIVRQNGQYYLRAQ